MSSALPFLILVDEFASCGFWFTAHPEAPAFVSAGACGWAVNDWISSLLIRMVQQTAIDVNVLQENISPRRFGKWLFISKLGLHTVQ